MADTAHDPRPRQSSRMDMDTASTAAEVGHRLHWEALVETGLIGNPVPTPPDFAANRAATDALFGSLRRIGVAADGALAARGR